MESPRRRFALAILVKYGFYTRSKRKLEPGYSQPSLRPRFLRARDRHVTHTAQTSFSDANLYAAIHQVLEAERASDGSERRHGRRHAYRCVQLIAPILDGRLPNQSQFRHVQCDDLSGGGLAYLSDEPAESDELIVVLGVVPFVFVKTQVVRQEQISRDGRSLFRIACRFVSRVVEGNPAAVSC